MPESQSYWVIECNGSYYTGNGFYNTSDYFYAARYSTEYQGVQASDSLNQQNYCNGNNRVQKIVGQLTFVSDDDKVAKVPFNISKFLTEPIEEA